MEQSSETHVTRTVGCATAPTKTAEWKEATSAQAVKRGHYITMIEVPDEDNDISFQRWLATGAPIAATLTEQIVSVENIQLLRIIWYISQQANS